MPGFPGASYRTRTEDLLITNQTVFVFSIFSHLGAACFILALFIRYTSSFIKQIWRLQKSILHRLIALLYDLLTLN